MGCGGSRTDALEPRYVESWTKETESTWLTSTDADIPLSSIQSIPSENSEAGFTSEKAISPVPDFFEDSLPPPAQAYLKVCSAVSEASLNDVKPSSPPAIVASPHKEDGLASSGTTGGDTKHLRAGETGRNQKKKMTAAD
ncbi:uncharacterized protein baalcb isoform X3 [Channa argus]|uniref:uncharacterized protein baalcb isoform X3 n=1 Tax=Channa argus TaxID=215402 RepID=UPI00351FF7FA